ncbi:MAG: hypothetical protein GAK37_02287 [Pseudomonas sp.]|nr:MAG: hypothetical protein GAK37_02287 [Pseudomonas sp.]
MNSVDAHAFAARPLGPLEAFLWSCNQQDSKVFAVAAQIAGRTAVEDWHVALQAVQRRHPLLRAGIEVNAQGRPVFVERAGVQPVLEVLDAAAHAWQDVFARELHTRTGDDDGLLWRATLLYSPEQVTVILAAHHSIGDGLSLAYVIRDWMQAMGPQKLEAYALPGAQESTLGLPPEGFDMPVGAPLERAMPLVRGDKPPRVHSQRLTFSATRALVTRARTEDATVHGALVVALTLAGAEREASWNAQSVRVKSPINIRELIGLKDECMLSVFSADTCLELNPHDDFWQAARRISAEVGARRNVEAFTGFSTPIKLFFDSLPPVGAATELLMGRGPMKLLVSNLGVLPFEPGQGGLHLVSMWGPSTFMGIQGEQNVGVITVNGELHMTHSSYSPIHGLLEGARKHLERVVG